MASRKKAPSFDIPASIRRAGQAGWVYRTESTGRKGSAGAGRTAARRKPARHTVGAVETVTTAPATVAAAAPPSAADAPSVAGRLVGLGLQVAAVPFMVPLFLTAAVSRRLGTTSRQ